MIRVENYNIDVYGNDSKYVYYCSDGFTERKARLGFRDEKTWNDHMGNTPCGYFFQCILPNGRKRRVYLSQIPGYYR